MSMTRIERAERISAARAILFYLMAATLLVAAVLNFDRSGTAFLAPIVAWVVLALLVSFNLTPWATRLRHDSLRALLDDESTRAHRRTSFEVGFWATIACATATMIVTSFVPLAAPDIARLILSVALAVALASFATLEWRAARG